MRNIESIMEKYLIHTLDEEEKPDPNVEKLKKLRAEAKIAREKKDGARLANLLAQIASYEKQGKKTEEK